MLLTINVSLACSVETFKIIETTISTLTEEHGHKGGLEGRSEHLWIYPACNDDDPSTKLN
jgi:hypothetical protein